MHASAPDANPNASPYGMHAATHSQRATYWGVVTWVTNLASFLLTAVPIALPISIILFIVSVVTGFMSLYHGFIGWYQTRKVGGQLYKDALVGLALGVTHFAFLIFFSVAVLTILWIAGVIPPKPQ